MDKIDHACENPEPYDIVPFPYKKPTTDWIHLQFQLKDTVPHFRLLATQAKTLVSVTTYIIG